ncbi:hypothetical protein ISN44_As02g003210 [Arabidopsis suecica]|uniref:Uncharacterized protein n=1 Tax=Arabidopsis suecica TaxID=45249 RepID=A0A8T2FWP4_ARASU|nr:hypothetical protein ISN44_As02g003210 [Arabidopsis suecica]
MIPSPRYGDYHSFLTFQSPSPLFTEFSLVKSINFSDKLLMLMKTLKLRSGNLLLVLNQRLTLCDILNLHSQGHYARENPPVLLQFHTYLLRTLVIASAIFLSLTTDPCSFSTSLCLVTMTNLPLPGSIVVVSPIYLLLACAIVFYNSCLRASMVLSSDYCTSIFIVFIFVVLNSENDILLSLVLSLSD